MFSQSTLTFIRQHLNDDVRALALRQNRNNDVDIKEALDQIAGWQKARGKLPLWASTEGIVYPPHLSMEQCSSQTTAEYKAEAAKRLTEEANNGVSGTFVDLTGGFGVDFSYISRHFSRALYVEQQAALCRIAEHNFKVLQLHQTEVFNTDAESFLSTLDQADLIFLDPARRDSAGNRTYAITDCTPDALALKPLLLDKAPIVMLKLSPMLDWRKAASDFKGAVSEVHILAVDNECKELLLVLTRGINEQARVFCVNDNFVLSYKTTDTFLTQHTDEIGIDAFKYICEPNTAVMKAGCFTLIEQRYSVRRIGVNSNLFVSHNAPQDFPGRVFIVDAVSTMNRRELKAMLQDVTQANITVRNFPLSVAELRKRLKIKDGGDCYIFATTDAAGRHLLVKGHKATSKDS